MSISKSRPEKIIINNEEFQFADEATVLGMKFTRTGITKHVSDRVRKAKLELGKLKRFNRLSTKTKCHLYKTLIRPVPNCIASNKNKQHIQKRAAKFINKYSGDNLTIREIQEKYNLEPLNVRLYHRANKCWDRFTRLEPNLTEQSTQENNNLNIKDHFWWRRVAFYVNQPPPEPMYTEQ